MVSIVLLGTGGAAPSPDRTPPGAWVEVDGCGLLLDPGPGAVSRLLASPYGPTSLDELDTVLFTHFHPDHAADLLPLLFSLRLPDLVSDAPLTLAGPVGLEAYLDGLRRLYGEWAAPRRRSLRTCELSPEQGLARSSDPSGGWSVTSAASPPVLCHRAAHGEDRFSRWNLGYRFRDLEGRTLVHTGDSGPCRELAIAACGCDVLITECSLPPGCRVDGHMAPEDVAELALETSPRRVVLTHLPPGGDEAAVAAVRALWPGAVSAARDGDRIVLPENPNRGTP